MSNIVDIRARLKSNPENSKEAGSQAAVLDMTEKRSEALQEDRRRVKRTILTEFIAVHTIIPGCGLMKVALFDLNEKGLAFDVENRLGHFQVGEEIPLRIYLNYKTYFEFSVKIKNSRLMEDEGVYRHGAEFMESNLNDVALHHFVKFLETVSVNLRRDRGDILVTKINS